ncbi:MAG: hypothetical protein C5B53_07680 [Candidatus Melainabacteria bacterium]|nr:MAG: hypothetical protein C5B53_07680 [Candidatus Melainabacteria bacterium]
MLEAEAVRTISAHTGNAGSSVTRSTPVVDEHPANYYEILGLDRFASTNEVEKAFLKRVRFLLSSQDGDQPSSQFKEDIVSLFVARDVLKDPLSREEHDFQLLSLRRKSSPSATPSWKWLEEIDAGRMQVAEALMLAELASTSTLQMELELHETASLEQFKTCLVEDRVVSELQLDAAILARLLLKRGRLRKASLKRIFRAVKNFGVDFIDSLLVTIDISLDELIALAHSNELKCLQESLAERLEKKQAVAVTS